MKVKGKKTKSKPKNKKESKNINMNEMKSSFFHKNKEMKKSERIVDKAGIAFNIKLEEI